jgi:hypothetical protein
MATIYTGTGIQPQLPLHLTTELKIRLADIKRNGERNTVSDYCSK